MVPARFVHLRAALAVLIGVLAVAVAAVTGPSASSILATVAAVAVAGAVAVLARRVILAPAQRSLTIGHRSRRHREALDRLAEPSHPDTAGTPRPRAPGAVVPAA